MHLFKTKKEDRKEKQTINIYYYIIKSAYKYAHIQTKNVLKTHLFFVIIIKLMPYFEFFLLPDLILQP